MEPLDVESGTSVPSFAPPPIDEIQEMFSQCRSELVGNSDPSSYAFTTDQEWFLKTGNEVVRLLQDVGNRTRKMPSGSDQLYFLFTLIPVTAGGNATSSGTTGGRTIYIRKSSDAYNLDLIRDALSSVDDISYYIICSATIGLTISSQLLSHAANVLPGKISSVPGSDISKIATFIFSLILKEQLRMSVHDIVQSLHILLPEPGRDTTEGRVIRLPPIDNWYSAKSSSLMNATKSTILNNAKTIVFPGPYPNFKLKAWWMERNKLHGKPPDSASEITVWGSWKSDNSTWTTFMAFSDQVAATTYAEKLEASLTLDVSPMDRHDVSNTIANENSDRNGAARQPPPTHFLQAVHNLYRLGLNDACIRLIDAADEIEHLKYQDTVGSALACLMLMNHLEYHKRIVESLMASIPGLHSANEMDDIADQCRSLINDVSRVYDEARSARSLIIEQINLSQSSNLGYLTILATVFVPMTAVAGIFGMNTMEINGSNWPIKYFIVSAVPLTVVAVLLPLTALWILEIIVKISNYNTLISIIVNGLLLCSLITTLAVDIAKSTNIPDLGPKISDFQYSLAFLSGLPLYFYVLFHTLDAYRHIFQRRVQPITMWGAMRRKGWRFFGSAVFVTVYYVGVFIESWLCVGAIVSYFMVLGFHWYLKKRMLRLKKRK
ncbi:cora-like Mg2+ transporter protein-domain-containing protein [Xylariales sp. PMI_506]|nr:cora-like Mg2+ transporter protein-domain-containing protein [Xylariales sp. PMI_506]